ncbi:LuxR C-terminal-related transcriptional regulator [Luteimonas sp. SDU101]|uniref:helix-turn-helix transcriptional regulator n=1 Tax=Luteimonas sp. SDU101 TaxID=3422593 RepID=UPI003EBEB529
MDASAHADVHAALDGLIHTRVAPPVWLGEQIRRDALLSRLDGALQRRLTLIHAPAGYGKTSLLAQWRQRQAAAAVRIAWLTLESDDTDLKRLAGYLSLALADGDAPAMPADLPPRAALSAIIKRLASQPQAVAIVFDDFHRGDSPALSEFIASLVRLAPGNCHFIVASRDHPLLGQSVLAAEDQLLEFGASDLRFSAAETEALLERNRPGPLGRDDLRRIFERTEGWPIALQLVALSLRRGADPGALVSRFSGSGSELARYLSEQVLVALPDDMQEVVMRTALADRLTGEVVNLLCDRDDGWLLLERLEQQGMFLASLPGGPAWRYHQLFAEYMRERLQRRDAAQYRALQRRLAEWFGASGQLADAVHHAIRADASELLAGIVEAAGAWRLIPKGLQVLAERAIEALPQALVGARPRLALMRIYLAIKRGELAAARLDYDRLCAEERQHSDADLRTEILIVGDVLIDYENAPVSLDDLLEREALLRSLPGNDHLMLANICELLGAKYYEGGWLERAMEPTLAAREHYQALGSLYSDLFTRFLEARIRRAQGRAHDAANILAVAKGQIVDNFGAHSDLAANCDAFEAELLYEQDRLDEAAERLAWSLPHMEQSDGWVDVYAAAYFTAARIGAARGAMEDALAMLSRARRLAARRRLRQLELLAQLHELQLLLHAGCDDAAAHALADGIGLDALASEMDHDRGGYRQVAAMAAMCRARLLLVEGEAARALSELERLRQWATRHGAGRLLLDTTLLLAQAQASSGDAMAARASFDAAVGMAMFQGIVRPFIDAQRFVEPLLGAVQPDAAQGDRFRGQFLRTLTRAYAARPMDNGSQGLLTDAEVEVIEPLCRGLSNKEIARAIGMSPDTVKYRLKSLFRKIDVHRRKDAVRVLRERGLAGGAEQGVD